MTSIDQQISREMSKIRRLLSDILRVGFLMGVVGYLLYLADPANAVVFQAAGIAIFLVGGTHLTRRILFSRMDLQKIALESIRDKNLPGALIVLGVIAFLISVMHLSMTVFK